MLQIYQNSMIFVYLLSLILIISTSFEKRLTVPQSLIWITAVFSSLYPAFSVFYNPQEYLNPIFLSASKVTAAQSAILALLVPIVVLFTNKTLIRGMLRYYFLFEAVSTLIFGSTLTLGWSAFSSTMLALSIPLFYLESDQDKVPMKNLIFMGIVFVASLLNYSYTTLFIYLFIASVFLWKEYKSVIFMIFMFIGWLKVYINPAEFQTGNGRFDLWHKLIVVWNDSLPKLFGTGLGTWEWVFPQIKAGDDFLGYSMVHNDYFQILLEMGFIGLFFFMWFLFEALYRNRRNVYFIIPAGSFLIAMTTYFPLHVVPGQLLALYYLIYYDRKSVCKY